MNCSTSSVTTDRGQSHDSTDFGLSGSNHLSADAKLNKDPNALRESKGLKKLLRQLSRDSVSIKAVKERRTSRDSGDITPSKERTASPEPTGLKKLLRQLSRDSVHTSIIKDRRSSRDSGDVTMKKEKKGGLETKGLKKFFRQLSRDSVNVSVINDRRLSHDSADVTISKDRRSSRDFKGLKQLFKQDSRDSINKQRRESIDVKQSSELELASQGFSKKNLSRSSSKKKWLPVLYDGMPYSIQEKARIELNESDEVILKGMAKLKSYVKKEKLSLDDILLLSYLRISKYDWKKAQEKLKRFCNVRRKLAEVFDQKLDVETARKLLQHKCVGILPHRDEEGRAIIFTRGIDWNSELCDFETYIAVILTVFFYLFTIPVTTVSGARYLCDVAAKSYNDYYAYYKGFKGHINTMIALPCRRVIVDTVHDNSVCRWLYSLLKPLLPSKIVKRLRMHGYSTDSLHDSIDFSILPEEYGGTMGPINNDFFTEQYLEFLIKFKEQNKFFLKR